MSRFNVSKSGGHDDLPPQAPSKLPEEKEKKSKVLPATLLASIAALGIAYSQLERMAEWLTSAPDEPTLPEQPSAPTDERPERPVFTRAERGSVHLAIGVDNSKSAIARRLGLVKDAIRSFIETAGGGTLKDGDAVTLCVVSDGAECERFNYPEGKDRLLAKVDGIEGTGMHTYLTKALSDILADTHDSAERLFIALWTDGNNEEAREDRIAIECEDAEKCPPIAIVAPDRSFLPPVRNFVQGVNVEYKDRVSVELASTGAQFNALLVKFTGELQRLAQAASDAEKQGEFDGKEKAYEEAMQNHQKALEDHKKALEDAHAAYEKAMDEYVQTIESRKEAVQDVKRKIRYTLFGLFALVGALGTALLYNNKRPKLSGYLTVENSAKKSVRYSIPRSKKPYIFRIPGRGEAVTLIPTRRGVKVGNRILVHGDNIAEGVVYYSGNSQQNAGGRPAQGGQTRVRDHSSDKQPQQPLSSGRPSFIVRRPGAPEAKK